jgi:phosphate uptake regulator/aminoglycoside phosphotransferase (APT) family kinase protein
VAVDLTLARAIDVDLMRMERLVVLQLRRGLASFRERDLRLAEEVIERDDVVDALNLELEERAMAGIVATQNADERRAFRAVLKVAGNLERAGDAASHIAKRTRIALADGDPPVDMDLGRLEHIAVASLDESIRAFLYREIEIAKTACAREPELDHEYVLRLGALRTEMRADPERIGSYLHVHTVMKYLEKVADYSLNIAEQALFVITRRRLKFAQFQSLDRLGMPAVESERFQRFWDGISGAVVARVETADEMPAVYKEGARRKIAEEAERLTRWAEVAPGLAPSVLGTVTLEERMALLREFIEGTLLSDLLAEPSILPSDKVRAIERLAETLLLVWERTARTEPAREEHVRQIEQRLGDIFALHPHLEPFAASGLGQRGRPLAELLDAARAIEPELASPVSVWLHGDMNANNVIAGRDGTLRFIDVHRSHYGDPLQDVAVFLVSLVRATDVTAARRATAEEVGGPLVVAAQRFAEQVGDRAFAQRLRLARARSYITSARVVVGTTEATRLFTEGMRELEALAGDRE